MLTILHAAFCVVFKNVNTTILSSSDFCTKLVKNYDTQFQYVQHAKTSNEKKGNMLKMFLNPRSL